MYTYFVTLNDGRSTKKHKIGLRNDKVLRYGI